MTTLSGKVAVTADGAVTEIRDLGPEPVAVKPNVLPLAEQFASLGEGQEHGPPVYTVEADRVVAAYPAVDAPVERRLVAKATIVERLETAGLLEAARSALDAETLLIRERWNAHTAIYADDQTARSLLTAIGADPETILAAK